MDNHPVPAAKRQLAAQTLFVSQLMDTHTLKLALRCAAQRPNLSHNVLRCSHGTLSTLSDQDQSKELRGRGYLTVLLCDS